MTEHLPMTLHLELDKKLFTEAVNSVGVLMAQRGARPWTFDEDAVQRANLDGMENLPGITGDQEVGRLTEITGKAHGVSYNLDFLMYNEIAGAHAHSRVPMIDMRVTATVGDVLYPKGAEPDGTLRGLIWLYPDRTTTADFGHGTTASSNPEVQEFLERLIGYYGVDTEDLFGQEAHQGFVYNDERLKKLISGLHELSASEL